MNSVSHRAQARYLSVIVPAFNEEDRIESTLHSINSYLSAQHYTYEIIVVNDGSKDKTVEITSRLLTGIPHLRLIDNKENRGKGWAVKCGMISAKGEIRLFMDADNSTTIDQIENMFPHIENGFDVVIGSRRVKDAVITVHQSIFRERIGQIFNLIVRIINGLKIKDTQAGFKMFSSSAAEKIFPMQTIWQWAFDVELLMIAQKLGFKIKEVPITWRNNPLSHVRLKGMIMMLFDLTKTRLNLWTGVYNKQPRP